MKAVQLRARFYKLFTLGVGLTLLVWAGTRSEAQLSERPNDPTGFSLRTARTQVIHSEDAARPGTSMYLQRKDPWLAYELGHSYFQREWGKRDGVFTLAGARPFSAAVNSCAMCHNQPFRSAGFGGNSADPHGFGQNAPHLFGIGLVETLSIQVRRKILDAFDTNRNNFLDVPAETRGRRAVVEAAPGVLVDFGALEDLDGDGYPGLNQVIKVTFVDAQGRAVQAGADGKPPRLGDAGVSGYDIAVGFLSSALGDHHLPSLRVFAIGVVQTVLGMSVADPTVTNDGGRGRDERAGDGWAETSNAGAPQPYFPLAAKGCGGLCLPVSAGELDLLEWYLLNHPAPALGPQDRETARGRRLMDSFGCTKCHVADWHIDARDERAGLTGDRRFFELEVGYDPRAAKLQGSLHRLTRDTTLPDGSREQVPRGGAYVVRNIFTDLRHHHLGERFYRYTYLDGRLYVDKMFRTPALWGVGSSAPYGYDGRSPTLDDVIRRHGGEAEDSARAYTAAKAGERRALVAFLESLVLYQPDELPTDLDGDGRVAESFTVNGRGVGPERFRPELLFRVAPLYRGWVAGPDGGRYFSYELLNVSEVYGRTLEALIDADLDGVPDAVGPADRAAGSEKLKRGP